MYWLLCKENGYITQFLNSSYHSNLRKGHGFHLIPVSHHIYLKFFLEHLTFFTYLTWELNTETDWTSKAWNIIRNSVSTYDTVQFHGSLLFKTLRWILIEWRRETCRPHHLTRRLSRRLHYMLDNIGQKQFKWGEKSKKE